MEPLPQIEEMLTPKEAANVLRVDARTLWLWAKKGQIRSIKLPSGHSRYPVSAVRAVVEGRLDEARPDFVPTEPDPRDMLTIETGRSVA